MRDKGEKEQDDVEGSPLGHGAGLTPVTAERRRRLAAQCSSEMVSAFCRNSLIQHSPRRW